MPLSVNPNLSALRALGKKQQSSANNIANLDSAKFKKSDVVMEEHTSGGVTARTQRINSPGVMVAQEDGSLLELSNVDLGEELVDSLQARHAYAANLKALQAEGEMQDQTLDLLG